MLERKHVEAIKKAWAMYKHDHHNPVPWKWERTVDNSIDAALAAADEREREFQKAREAWRKYGVDEDAWHDLDAYFNPAKGE